MFEMMVRDYKKKVDVLIDRQMQEAIENDRKEGLGYGMLIKKYKSWIEAKEEQQTMVYKTTEFFGDISGDIIYGVTALLPFLLLDLVAIYLYDISEFTEFLLFLAFIALLGLAYFVSIKVAHIIDNNKEKEKQ